ncbi:MAG: SLBB domain-containing protein [Gemmatimonadota bacterium]
MRLTTLAGWSLLLGGCGSTAPPAQTQSAAPPPAAPQIPRDPALQAYTEENGFPEYVIGPGDVLQLTLRDVQVVQETVKVRPDGNISFSLVENLPAAGRTPTRLDHDLTVQLARYLRDPRVDVEVTEFNSQVVSLLGAIRQSDRPGYRTGQGRYALKTKTTILDMILEAGGTTPDAQLNRVQLIRDGRSHQVDVQRVLDTGDRERNVILQGGDIVIVPGTELRSKKVVVLGEVTRPNVYMFSGDARLLEALSQAGGLTDGALRDDVRLIRVVDGQPRMWALSFDRAVHQGDFAQNVSLQNDDIIYVPRSFMGDVNEVIGRIEPLLSILLLPATYRDLYTTGGGLRLDTGLPEGGTGTVYTRPLPGTGKPAPAAEEEKPDDGRKK